MKKSIQSLVAVAAIALTTLVLIAFTSYRSAMIAMNSHSHAALVAPDEWHQAAIDSARRMIWTTGLGSGLAFVLVATAGERISYGRSGIYDVTVRRGDEVVAEFRGRSRVIG